MALDLVNSPTHKLCFIGVLLMFWGAAYYISMKTVLRGSWVPQNRKIEMGLLITPLIHGSTAWMMSLFMLPLLAFNQKNTNESNHLCFYSASHLIVDLWMYWKYNLCSTSLIIHHVSSFLCLITPIVYDYGAAECIIGVSILEATNFPLNFSTVLRHLQMTGTLLYRIVRNYFYIAYLVMRFPITIYFLFIPAFTKSPKSPWIIKLAGLGLLVQSYFFGRRIMEIVTLKLKKLGINYEYLNDEIASKQSRIENFFDDS